MGMFDYVHFEMNCPECGAIVNGFQSKDGDCDLEFIEPDGLDSFYSYCNSCKSWIEFNKPRKNRELRDKSLTLQEIDDMGYTMKVTKTNG